MKQVSNGYIIFDNHNKCFLNSDGDTVETMFEAKYFEDYKEAETFKNYCDVPELYEIWQVIKSLETIY